MDFVAKSIYNIYFSFESFWHLRLLLFQIKSQSVDVCKSVAYKKQVILFWSLWSIKKITFPRAFIFMFISYFIGAVLSRKCCQNVGVGKR